MTGTDWLVDASLAPAADDLILTPLYARAAEGELALPFCASCGQPLDLDQQVCDGCRHEGVAWHDVERTGVVHSATLVHRLEPGLVVATDPYPVLDVEVSSGHRLVMTSRLPATSVPDLGTPVTIGFRRVGTTSVPAAEYLRPTREVAP